MKMTIDPGLAGTGWAVWDERWELKDHGVIYPKSDPKSSSIVSGLLDVTCDRGVFTSFFVEEPAFMEGGRGVVTARSGSLVKLLLLVGMIMQEFGAEGVKVRDWKGQLPKDVVIRRIKRVLPDCLATSHDWDAVGMGLYLSGRF